MTAKAILMCTYAHVCDRSMTPVCVYMNVRACACGFVCMCVCVCACACIHVCLKVQKATRRSVGNCQSKETQIYTNKKHVTAVASVC